MDPPTADVAEAPAVEEDTLHEKRVRLSKEADEIYPGAGWTFYQWWRDLNEELYGRQMRTCRIEFNLLPTGSGRFGFWDGGEDQIVLARSLLKQDGSVWWPHHRVFGSRFPRDVLLRQMVFQYIETVREVQICGHGKYPESPLSENEWWIGEINRLSQEMDLGGRLARLSSSNEKSNLHLTRKEVEWWPYSIRPEGHYDRSWTEVLGEEK